MQESVRRIIEAEEARMGKDCNTTSLFHKVGERKEQYKHEVVKGGMKHRIIAVVQLLWKAHCDSASGVKA